MMTGSDGVSFLLPQLFLSQHRLQTTWCIIIQNKYQRGLYIYNIYIYVIHTWHVRRTNYYYAAPVPRGFGPLWSYKYAHNPSREVSYWRFCLRCMYARTYIQNSIGPRAWLGKLSPPELVYVTSVCVCANIIHMRDLRNVVVSGRSVLAAIIFDR